jgi:hypothetical protein
VQTLALSRYGRRVVMPRARPGLPGSVQSASGRKARRLAVQPPAKAQGLVTPRAFQCRCGRPVFFRNSQCLACHTPLGYWPEQGRLLPLQDAGDGLWRAWGSGPHAPRFHRCAHLHSAASCNWLVTGQPSSTSTSTGTSTSTSTSAQPLCRCCALTRILPDLSQAEHPLWWSRIEVAKRRLVSSLIGLGLPVQSWLEDAAKGLAFDLLRAAPGGGSVITGHADGVITLDVAEADDAWREQRRTALAEPYRTLLGHLRHETGHYYWHRLIEGSAWLPKFRQKFGDERQDYTAALQQHYDQGAPVDWSSRHVSAYASSHPWEDWAETWAHYLHLRDALDTARSFGIDGEQVELNYERFSSEDALLGEGSVDEAAHAQADQFLRLVNSWMELSGVLNELTRSMGVADFYPFVLSRPALAKLYLVHRVVTAPTSVPQASGVRDAELMA